jgi:hypothetical protein
MPLVVETQLLVLLLQLRHVQEQQDSTVAAVVQVAAVMDQALANWEMAGVVQVEALVQPDMPLIMLRILVKEDLEY